MSATDLQPSNKTSHLRRSQRVCLRLPIVVLREGPGDNVVSEETHTLIVNAHGALILRDSGESLSRRQIGPLAAQMQKLRRRVRTMETRH
jgi:hypothetical protein